MPLTLDEITEHEKRVRREIAERECLLAALKVLRGYSAQGDTPTMAEPGSVLSHLVSFTPRIEWKEMDASPAAAQLISPAAPPPAPRPAPPTRYIHPELAAIGNLYGASGKIVKWAISRMTDDYTVRDLDALLEREGNAMHRAHISLTLASLKKRGEIEQLKPRSGASPPSTANRQTPIRPMKSAMPR